MAQGRPGRVRRGRSGPARGAGGPRRPDALLCVTRPPVDRPEFDRAVWIDVLTQPSTPGSHVFRQDLERFLLATFDGEYALTRVEWSKSRAYTDTGPGRTRRSSVPP
ncbi:cholesterol oxidase substrate-binding domain-containing protein [Streptomyces sp. NPDC002911]